MTRLSGAGWVQLSCRNKDLRRVLSIARLVGREAVEDWPGAWQEALRATYADQWPQLGVLLGGASEPCWRARATCAKHSR